MSVRFAGLHVTNPLEGRTIRGLILATVAAALAWAGWSYHQRREAYLRLVLYHQTEMTAFEEAARSYGRMVAVFEGRAPRLTARSSSLAVEDTRAIREERETLDRRAGYHAGLVRKYREAARRPWLGVEADPPPP